MLVCLYVCLFLFNCFLPALLVSAPQLERLPRPSSRPKKPRAGCGPGWSSVRRFLRISGVCWTILATLAGTSHSTEKGVREKDQRKQKDGSRWQKTEKRGKSQTNRRAGKNNHTHKNRGISISALFGSVWRTRKRGRPKPTWASEARKHVLLRAGSQERLQGLWRTSPTFNGVAR